MSHPGEFLVLDDASVVAPGTGREFPRLAARLVRRATRSGSAPLPGRAVPVRRTSDGRPSYGRVGWDLSAARPRRPTLAGGHALGAGVGQPGPATPVHHRSKGRPLAMVTRPAISAFLGLLIAEPWTLRIFQLEVGAPAPLPCRWSTVHPRWSADRCGARSLGRGGTLERSS